MKKIFLNVIIGIAMFYAYGVGMFVGYVCGKDKAYAECTKIVNDKIKELIKDLKQKHNLDPD